ncbi:hypothetical protein F5148DRAFT_999971 [Russula earlei]|uniref:Uncharacterized protein n=1 Tax=Russula earlei TaxID=71964 RepID=A0ACC0U751_9AGAM|nr:hypothetical protein F5148DRAFT_999971 [Russula earlei]
MSSRRDDLFPSGSIGRSQGLFIQRTPSPAPSLTRETLTAHPLLSPTPVSAPISAAPTSDAQETTPPGTRYATYTPRRTAATTVTTLQSSLSVAQQQPPGGSAATSKLQLMNLKAGAQSIGLETNSLGWEILEKLVAEHDNSPEWSDIWNVLTVGKATLLLPIESAGSTDVTADFVKDHVALCESPSGDNIPIVTMSGLRGSLVSNTLTLRSSLLPGSKSFDGLLVPSTRVSAFASLPPLPVVPSPFSQSYPTFTLPAHTDSLPLPPHVVSKPPLPPRPGQRAPAQTSSSRISSSLASLFGKSSAPTTPAPTPSQQNIEHEHAIEVAAYSIDQRIVRNDVSKAINKVLKNEVKETLASSGVPSWVIDRVHDFTVGLHPFVRSSDMKQGTTPPSLYVIDPPQETAEELATQFQAFYVDLEEALLAGGVSPVTARPIRESILEAEQEKARERRPSGKIVSEQRAREILEAVERVICSLFYDRLYRLPKSDDASHDEALSSRVAALNMLDLGLEHLGVDVGAGGAGVEAVLKACGETLSRLENQETRCPAAKAAVLIAAHRDVVDGLSRLPPVRLKSEAELENQKSPEASPALKDRFATPHDGTAVPALETNPPPIIVSPDSQTQLHVESPVGIEDATPTNSNPSVAPSYRGQEGPQASYESTSDRASLRPVSTSSRSESPTPVSGDIILPLMIFSVVKANPSHFVSHLLYTQRFRNQRIGGEESYCLVNLMAVADFLENIDLKALGLGESDKKVMSTADLTPIPVHRVALESQAPPVSPEGVPARLRRGVEQQVDAIAGSANKVILGVVDQGFGVLRALLPGTSADAHATSSENTTKEQEAAPWNAISPGFGLLRRESGFSIASLAASLPGRDRARSFASTTGTTAEESGQMMVDVSSRPGSVRSASAYESDGEGSADGDSQDDSEDDEDDERDDDRHDIRSIRSFENMMGRAARRRRPRKSLSDRLASMPGLARLSGQLPQAQQQQVGSPSPSRHASLLPPPRALTPAANRIETPLSSRPTSPLLARIAPPNQRFLEATADDLRLSEVKELLYEYKRVVEGLRAMGGFDE